MKIAFDLRRIGNPGIGRYMKCLAESITAQAPEHEYLLILPPQREHLVHAPNAQKLCTGIKYYSLREQFELPRILNRYKVDLLHSPHFLLPLVRPCPAVATIHDVIYLACPEDLPSFAGRLYYRTMMNACSRMATRIVTDSAHSKAEISRYLNANPEKIEVVYPAVDPFFQSSPDPAGLASARSKFGIDRDYILYASIYKPRKNHVRLFEAYRLLLKNGIRSKLVIAGPMGAGEAILRRLAQQLAIAQHVVFTGLVTDTDLRALYLAARVYVCPSLYEGFGFTVLEAMACGTPVVCSSATSLPEVAGKAALYFDPHKPGAMAAQLQSAFSDYAVRTSLIANGRSNLLRFSWEETARQTLAAYYHALHLPLPRAAYA